MSFKGKAVSIKMPLKDLEKTFKRHLKGHYAGADVDVGVLKVQVV